MKDELLKCEIGIEVRKMRAEMRMSLREMARHCHLSGAYICRIEHGEHMPTLATFCCLCFSCDIDPAEVLKRVLGKRSFGQEFVRLSDRDIHNTKGQDHGNR